jgi:hypothetical protein
MDAAIRQQLLTTLAKIDRPGTFCTSGTLSAILLGLEVADIGPVALPLAKEQAAALKKHARQAPYGKGTKTLVDTDVRRVWEIDANQVELANPEWPAVLKQAVGTAQSELGLKNQKLQAHLYKLLLYEPGSFFLPHRDGEKLDRMVATLVIALPSAHKGGELVVRHEGREETVDFSKEGRFQTQFAAFYADCEHEIRPITSGFRLALVYNLALGKSKSAITAPTSREHIAAVVDILRPWGGQKQKTPEAGDAPPSPKMAVLLDHHYTQAGLTHDALKGVDRAKASVLFAAGREAGCDASLALVTYWESGSAEPSDDYGYGRRRHYGQSDDDFDNGDGEHVMGELYDSSLIAEYFSDADGNPLAYGRLSLDDNEIISEQPLNEGEPDKEDFEGYTGNAGMTLERWYRRAAVVLWPAVFRFDVLCAEDAEAAVGGLELMVRQWKQSGKDKQGELKQACLEFARRIIARWTEQKFATRPYSDYDFDVFADEDSEDQHPDDEQGDDAEFDEGFHAENDDQGEDRSEVGERDGLPRRGSVGKAHPRPFLALLQELGEADLIASYIRAVLVKDVSVDPGAVLGDVCEQHGWATFQDELLGLFEKTSNETLERHSRLLADLSTRDKKNADRRKLCSKLADEMMAAVERWDPKGPRRDWNARVVNRSELLPPLTQAFLALEEPKLLARLMNYVLDRPKDFDLTTVQVPALVRLETWLKGNVKEASSPLHRWLKAVVEELESRKSQPPKEPADWRREAATGCSCGDCKELSRFLKDPKTQTLRLALAKGRRQHLHQVIEQKKLDTTHVTERRGSPHTLVCTKTTASYQEALKAHKVDLDHLAKMRKLLAWHERL